MSGTHALIGPATMWSRRGSRRPGVGWWRPPRSRPYRAVRRARHRVDGPDRPPGRRTGGLRRVLLGVLAVVVLLALAFAIGYAVELILDSRIGQERTKGQILEDHGRGDPVAVTVRLRLPEGHASGYRERMVAHGPDRTFRVLAWVSERRFVLYVPEIEAATSVLVMTEADAAARSLIADLTGLAADEVLCDIELGRTPGGPPSLR